MADAASITRRVLLAPATCALTTIAAVSAASFTAAVAGARDGAVAFATPLGALDARLAVSARITAADKGQVFQIASNTAALRNQMP